MKTFLAGSYEEIKNITRKENKGIVGEAAAARDGLERTKKKYERDGKSHLTLNCSREKQLAGVQSVRFLKIRFVDRSCTILLLSITTNGLQHKEARASLQKVAILIIQPGHPTAKCIRKFIFIAQFYYQIILILLLS